MAVTVNGPHVTEPCTERLTLGNLMSYIFTTVEQEEKRKMEGEILPANQELKETTGAFLFKYHKDVHTPQRHKVGKRGP